MKSPSEVVRVLWIILALNLAVAAAKAIYGLLSASLAVGSDAMHSLIDGSGNVVALIALQLAARPPDEGHPYGHGKIEFLGSGVIGLLIGMSAIEIGRAAVVRLWTGGAPPHVTTPGIGVLAATLVVNVFVALYEARKGRELESPLLLADSAHTASDVGVTIAVIGSQIFVQRGYTIADVVVAAGVLVAVLLVAIRIFRTNADVLLDRAVVDAKRVEAVALGVEGVRGCHRVRSRGARESAQLDLHLLVDPSISVRDAHAISHAVQDRIRGELPSIADVTIHIEPAGDPDEGL